MVSPDYSLKKSFLPWHHKKVVMGFYHKDFKRLKSYFPEVDDLELKWFIHHIYLYDRGVCFEEFFHAASHIKDFYPDKFKLKALRLLIQLYYQDDFIWRAHYKGLNRDVWSVFWRLLSRLRFLRFFIKPSRSLSYRDISKEVRKITKSSSKDEIEKFLDDLIKEISNFHSSTWPELKSEISKSYYLKLIE